MPMAGLVYFPLNFYDERVQSRSESNVDMTIPILKIHKMQQVVQPRMYLGEILRADLQAKLR